MFADIQSSNIVGYTMKDANKGEYIILGAQFEGVTGSMKINDLVSGVAGVDYDNDGAYLLTAPIIQVPNGSGYTPLYYLNDGWVSGDTYVAGWCDDNGTIATTETTPGVAMWLKSVGADADVAVSGAVPSEDEASVTCPKNEFALRANVFPVATEVNSDAMKCPGIIGVDYDNDGAWLSTAPIMQIPNGMGGYTPLYYLNDGWLSGDTYVAGWCDDNGTIVHTTIPAAQGFWVKATTGAFDLKFSK